MQDGRQKTGLDRSSEEFAELLGGLLDVSDLLVVVTDPAGRIRLFNHACEALTGRGADEVIGKDLRELLIPADELESVEAVFERLVSDGAPSCHVNHWLVRDGGRRLIEWRNTVLLDGNGNVRHVVGTGIDITDRRQAEVAKRSRGAELRDLVDALPVLVAKLDTDHRIRFANRSYLTWFGLDPDAQVGRHVRDVIGDAAYEVLAPYYDRAQAGERVFFDGEVPYLHGGTRLVHASYLPSHDDDSNTDGLYILAVDLTEREQLRHQLNFESRRASTVLDTAVDGIVTIDEHGIIQSFNRAAEHMFGWQADEVIGRNVSLLMPEPHSSQHDDYLRCYLETGERRIIGIGREVAACHRDGSLVDIELVVGEFSEDEQRYFTGFTRDIRDRKRAEQLAMQRLEQLARVTRLHAMGELASGLAHEVNQPLTAIHATAEAGTLMLGSGRLDAERLVPMFDQIARQAKRASRVIEQMRTFLRTHDRNDMELLDPNELVRGVLPLLSHEVASQSVSVRLDLSPDVPEVLLNEVQIEQAIFNIFKNGVEAMADLDDERTVDVTSRLVDDDRPACEIAITNSGPGIPPEHMPRLFDPYFSTKRDGLGQGLAICRSIVEAHGGSLQAENLSGRGVRFRIRLPIQSDETQ